eukprot:8061875-Lingulodinium_polyedra.AAC.1
MLSVCQSADQAGVFFSMRLTRNAVLTLRNALGCPSFAGLGYLFEHGLEGPDLQQAPQLQDLAGQDELPAGIEDM